MNTIKQTIEKQKWQHNTKIVYFLIFFTALALLVLPISAQSGDGYDLSWHTVASGGGMSSGSGYTVTGTIGQIVVGHSNNATYAVSSGFWSANTSSDLNKYLLTTNTAGTGNGSITRSPNGTSYIDGTKVTLTAVPATGSTFTGWSGAGCSGTGTCIITMDQAQLVTASFAIVPPTVTPVPPTGQTDTTIYLPNIGN